MQLINPTNVLLALPLLFTTARGLPASLSPSVEDLPSTFPACAEPALLAGAQTFGCPITDVHCICSRQELLPSLISAIDTACDPADRAAVVAFAQTYCGTSVLSNVHANLIDITKMALAPRSDVDSAMGLTTAVGLPASTLAPATTSTPSGALIVDTTVLSTNASITTPVTTLHNYTQTMTYSTTSSAKTTTATMVGAAPENLGYSFAAFAIAVAVMTFLFAEL
ncbi:hypothetical protein LTR08_008436 [Meristemomyces frigidus]|nr:hypothetical protein LTR08_008436 [Meristemomyces frigidus]